MATDLGRSTLTGTASVLNAVPISSEVFGYQTISVQIAGIFSGILTFQGCNDNINFENVFAQPVGTPNDGKAVVATSINGVYHIPINFRYFQVKMTTYVSGTATLTVELYQTSVGEPVGPQFVNVQDGAGNALTSTLINSKQRLDVNTPSEGIAGSTVPVQILQVGGKDLSGNLQPISIDENSNLISSDEIRAFASQSKVFSAQSAVILVGTAETPVFLLRNPNASGKTLKIFKINVSGAGTFRIYYFPTVTANGTTINPFLRKITSGAQGNIALATASPTISVNGNLADTFVISAQEGTSDFSFPSFIIMSANTSLVITAQMVANNTSTSTEIEWIEL